MESVLIRAIWCQQVVVYGMLLNINFNIMKIWLSPLTSKIWYHHIFFLMCQQDSKEPVSSDKIMVRGRIYDESKPQTFNQSWTDEEQRKWVMLPLYWLFKKCTVITHRSTWTNTVMCIYTKFYIYLVFILLSFNNIYMKMRKMGLGFSL